MSAEFLIDTDTCTYLISRRPPGVLVEFARHAAETVGISSITLAELNYGVERSGQIEANRTALESFSVALRVYLFDGAAAKCYGRIRAELAQRGAEIGPIDLLIAAHALSLGAVLVTNNVREFERVPGLRIENWLLAG